LQKEVTTLKSELSRIASTSKFADVLDGVFSSLSLVDPKVGQTIIVNVERDRRYGTSGLFVAHTSVITELETSAAMVSISDAISIIDVQGADLGVIQNCFQLTIRSLCHISENDLAARKRILDTYFAVETAELSRRQIIQSGGIIVLGQAHWRSKAALQLMG
jgi:flagellin